MKEMTENWWVFIKVIRLGFGFQRTPVMNQIELFDMLRCAVMTYKNHRDNRWA